MLTLKEVLFQQCEDFVNTRFQTIQKLKVLQEISMKQVEQCCN